MAVSFERIPANIRVPLFYAEISNRRGVPTSSFSSRRS